MGVSKELQYIIFWSVEKLAQIAIHFDGGNMAVAISNLKG